MIREMTDGPAPAAPLSWELEPSRATLRIAGIGTATVGPDGLPVVHLDPAADAGDEVVLLASTVPMGHLLAGRWPLRASAVELGGRGVVVASGPACGASTAAAALLDLGARLLADGHVLVERVEPGARPMVRATGRSIDLWPDALTDLGRPADSGVRLRAGSAKRRIDGPSHDPGTMMPIAAVVVQTLDPLAREVTIDRLSGFATVRAVTAASWHGWAIDRLGRSSDHLAWVLGLVGEVPIHRLVVPRQLGGARDTIDAVRRLEEVVGRSSVV